MLHLMLGALCLLLLAVLFMVITGIVVYATWNGALWWNDQRIAARGAPTDEAACGAHDSVDAGGPAAPPQWLAPQGCGPGGPSTSLMPAHQAPEGPLHWRAHSPCTVVVGDSSSPVVLGPRGVAEGAHTAKNIMTGYASQLAAHFGGNCAFHSENVAMVADAFALQAMDVCYCYLCLREVACNEGGAELSLNKLGRGTYSSRIWTVTLARFVKAAQKQRGAHAEERIAVLCQEWNYKPEHFLRMLASVEGPFERKHGGILLKAFQHSDVHIAEVTKALRMLGEQGSFADPSRGLGARLALSDAAASASAPAGAGEASAAAALWQRQLAARTVGKRALASLSAEPFDDAAEPAAVAAAAAPRAKKSRPSLASLSAKPLEDAAAPAAAAAAAAPRAKRGRSSRD